MEMNRLNNRLNAWDPDISPYCTFCRIIDRDTRIRDGFRHFFFECPVTYRLLQQWGAIFEPPINPNNPSFLQLYWYGAVEEPLFNPTALIYICDCFKYVLWKFKQCRKIPNFDSVRSQLLEIVYNSSPFHSPPFHCTPPHSTVQCTPSCEKVLPWSALPHPTSTYLRSVL